jgi:MSHA biogenesis protein MshQ
MRETAKMHRTSGHVRVARIGECLLLAALFFLLAGFGSPNVGTAASIKLEAATISVTGSKFTGAAPGGDLARDWTRVNFTQTFSRIPYVFTVPTKQGSQAGAHRIRNVSTSGFYIRSVEPHTFDGQHVGMQVTYLAVEACADAQDQCEVSVPLAEGGVERWMIGHVDTSRWIGWGRNSDDDAYWQRIGFSADSPFAAEPAVLAQIQSLANETGLGKALPQSRPWLTSAVKDVGSGGFSLALERSEATDKDTVTHSERIAWMAAPPGGRKNLLDANGLPVGYEIIRSGAVIKGWDNGSVFVNFDKTWSVNPQVIASLNSRNNREPVAAAAGIRGDGGWLRRDSADLSLKTRSGFVVDETHHKNKGQDNNRTRNSGEVAGIFAFERAFSIDPIALDHYRIVHDGSGQTCAPESITVKACANADCSSLYTGAVTLSLSPDASDANATWSGVGVSGDSVSFSTGQASLNLVYAKAGTISLDAVGTPITPKPSQCEINGVTGNCSLVISQCTIRPFEACDVSTSPCTENGVNLYTKISGNGAVVLNLIKIQTSGADKGKLDKNFATSAGRTVSVDLVTGSAGLDAATGCPNSLQTLAGSAIGNVTFSNGRANNVTVLPAASNSRAVKDVRLRYVLNQSGSQTTSCTTDGFTIRPAYLAVTGTAVASGKTLPGAAGASLAAGDAFSLEAQARTASAAVSPGYDGVPVLDGGVQSCMADSAATDSGDCPQPLDTDRLTGSFGAADPNTGKAGGSFSYDQAGAFRLLEDALIDTGFAAGDAGNQGCVVGDTSNIAGMDADEPEFGKVGCSIGSQASGAGSQAQFGRFHPAWFTLDSGAINAACGSFSYFGQNFGLDAVISARNQGGTKILTRYPGSGLELAAVRNSEPTTALHPATVFSADSEPGWVDGKAAIAWNQVQYAKPASLQAPVSDLQLGLRVLDADNRPMQAPDLFGQYRLIAGYAPELRFGRLRLSYAAGMEALPLSMPLTAQYWNGQVFTRNLADNCTMLTAPILTFFAQTADNQLASGNTSASFNATLVDGDANLRLSAPGAGKFGLLDLSFGVADWLKYDWDGVDQGADGFPFDDDPRARASFGKSKVQRKGGEKVIIRREIF